MFKKRVLSYKARAGRLRRVLRRYMNTSPPPVIPLQLSQALPVFRHITDLSPELKLLGDFPIASGAQSSIWLGEISNGQQVAVKCLLLSETQLFFRELYIWSHVIPHEHILPLLGVARVRDYIAFVSPWMPGRSLDFHLSNCSITERIRILTEVSGALAYLHRKGVVYANLELTTVVLDETKKAYLSSFFFSQTNWTGLENIDPELFSNKSYRRTYPGEFYEASQEDDVLGFSGLLLSLLSEATGRARDGRNINRLIRKLLQGQFSDIQSSLDIPEDLWTMSQACWDDMRRPTMEQIFLKMSEILNTMLSNEGSQDTEIIATSRPLKDISSEIKRMGDHPIAGGGYCDLYLGERLGKEKVALKLVRIFGSSEKDKEAARRRFMSEVQIWADLSHPRILEFYGICEYGTFSIYMVSPFLDNGNILEYLQNSPNANRHQLLIEAAEGLVYLHNRRPPVIHGDLKGGNILISNVGTAVLADFGLSRISHEITTSILHGTGSLRWMAPELVTTDDTHVGPLKTIQSDVYGYGHIMLEVLSNEKPFFNIKNDLGVIVELINEKRSGRPTGLVASQWLDDATWAYCQQCTAIDPTKRPVMKDVLYHLKQLFVL